MLILKTSRAVAYVLCFGCLCQLATAIAQEGGPAEDRVVIKVFSLTNATAKRKMAVSAGRSLRAAETELEIARAHVALQRAERAEERKRRSAEAKSTSLRVQLDRRLQG